MWCCLKDADLKTICLSHCPGRSTRQYAEEKEDEDDDEDEDGDEEDEAEADDDDGGDPSFRLGGRKRATGQRSSRQSASISAKPRTPARVCAIAAALRPLGDVWQCMLPKLSSR